MYASMNLVNKPMPANYQPDTLEYISMNCNSIISIQENAFENVVCQNSGHVAQG